MNFCLPEEIACGRVARRRSDLSQAADGKAKKQGFLSTIQRRFWLVFKLPAPALAERKARLRGGQTRMRG